MVVKIPKATVKRMVKEVSKDSRITLKAVMRLQDVVTDFARMTIADSVRNSQHRKRKTITEDDIILATT